MRWLSALLLCGFLTMASAVALQPPHSLAMQDPSPTPPSGPARDFCTLEKENLGDAEVVFDPVGAETGAVTALDIENPDPAVNPDAPRRYSGKLRLNFVTLPPTACLLGSLFYPAALITVRTGEIEIFVEPGPEGPADAPAPVVTVLRKLDNLTEVPATPGPIVVNEGDWVTIENRAIVGFLNSGGGPATFLVAAIHPDTDPGGGGGCGGGCRGQP